MKKVICCLFLVFCAISLSGCGKKKALTVDEVKSIVKKDGYSVNNNKSQYADYSDIEEALVVFNKDKVQFEFYVLNNEDNAEYMFDENVKGVSAEKAIGATETKNNGSNYHQYTLLSNGTYTYISQIDKTVLFATVEEDDSAYIMNIVNKLGY